MADLTDLTDLDVDGALRDEPPSLRYLRQAKTRHERRQALLGRMIQRFGAAERSGLLLAWTEPLEWDRVFPDSAETRENRQSFEAAARAGVVIEALKHRGAIRARRPGEPRVVALARGLVQEFIAAEAIREVLEWLVDFRELLRSETPTRVLEPIAMLGPERPGRCDCDHDDLEGIWHRAPVLVWIHEHHQLYNRVIWEILSEDSERLRRIRRALCADIRVPDRHIGVPGQAFGRHLDKSYASGLLEFVRLDPDVGWIGEPVREDRPGRPAAIERFSGMPGTAGTTAAVWEPSTDASPRRATGGRPGVDGPTQPPAAGDHLTIGIVDDDEQLVSTFAYWAPALFGGEHVVRQVTTIQDAVTLLEATPKVDVILVDGFIPRLPTDGLQVMANLRAAGYSGPMVAISSDDSVRAQMLDAGCVAACSKREPRKLEQVIRDLVRTA